VEIGAVFEAGRTSGTKMKETVANPPPEGQRENTDMQIRVLILSRIAMTTFLLAVFVFMQIQTPDYVTRISIPYFYGIILIVYVLSLFFSLFARIAPRHRAQIYLQVMTDVVMITALIFVTGGIRSTYAVFYPLVIIYAVLYLGRNGGLIAASAAAISYGLLIDLEFYKVIKPLAYHSVWEIPDTAGHVFLRIFVNILSFFVTAFLASFVVEKEKKTRALLLEKESAFNRLDLLHRAIIESVDAGILTTDLAGRIKSFNQSAERITGWRFAALENRDVREIFTAWDELVRTRNCEAADPHFEGRIETTVVTMDNRRLIIGCQLSPLRDHHGQKFGDILIFQDLTTVKKMEEALERNRRLAFVGEMAAGLAHEIRNPLASISGAVQMLQRERGVTVTEARLMQLIIRSKDQLEGFIKDFLLLARPERGPQQKVALGDFVREVLEAARVIPDWHDAITVREDIPPELSFTGNREELRQVVWNLVLNAVQAMPAGGRLEIQGREKTIAGRTGVEFIVADTGVGISEQDRASICEPFFTTKERGTGLGLAIVMRIVTGYGGKMTFESVPGAGSTFIIWLPQGEDNAGGSENGQDSRR